MNHSRVQISSFGRGCALAVFLVTGAAAAPAAAFADEVHPPALWFEGARLNFSESRPRSGDLAVSINDPGLKRFLHELGATAEFQSGQRYAVITTADHRSITFEIGSDRFLVEAQPQVAPFAVDAEESDAYLPFFALARALDVMPVRVGDETILQPEIAGVETEVDHGRSIVILRGAAALHPQLLSASPTRAVIRFAGIGSTLAPERDLASPGLTHLSVAVTGEPKNPTTTITFTGLLGTHLGLLPAPDATTTVVALASNSVPSRTESPPLAPPAPLPRGVAGVQPLSGLALTNLSETSTHDGLVVRLALNGKPSYRWRILGDGRFYIDFPGARLATADRDEPLRDSHVSALRLRSNGTPGQPNVRLALTLVGAPNVAVVGNADSVTLRVGGVRTASAPRDGMGPAAPVWKYGPQSSPRGSRNDRLIVLDPGHGGTDPGAQANGLTEKVLTLDVARRLRTLLIARGWQVAMTRDSDADVYHADDSAHDELQARCDLANAAGARLFVSIHVNSYTSADLQGTTTYFYHPQDSAFASAVENALVAGLGTQNDGAQHANFYVIHHTTMPAILVETAFLSNPGDATRLRSDGFRQAIASAITTGITAYTGGSQAHPPPPQEDASANSGSRVVRSAPTDDDLSQ
jgi:N-acetylmuramoyl-L-alanine amidase CwlD